MIQKAAHPCPLCGRITRAHSRIFIEDIGEDGTAAATGYSAVVCRDCAFATVVRAQAGAVEQAPRLQPPARE
jgi:D-serine dehydratase